MSKGNKAAKELRRYLKESIVDDYPNEYQEIRKEWNRLLSAALKEAAEAQKEKDAKVMGNVLGHFEDAGHDGSVKGCRKCNAIKGAKKYSTTTIQKEAAKERPRKKPVASGSSESSRGPTLGMLRAGYAFTSRYHSGGGFNGD